MGGLNSLYRSQSQYAFLTTIEPFSSRRSRIRVMSNLSKRASRTPRAIFSKSQNRARLEVSVPDGVWFAGIGLLSHISKAPSQLMQCTNSRQSGANPSGLQGIQ